MEQDSRAETPDAVQLRLKWLPTTDVLIQHADRFVLTFKGDYFVLTIGQVDEPALPPNDVEATRALMESGTVPIRPLARFSIPKVHMVDWAKRFQELTERVLGEQVTDDD